MSALPKGTLSKLSELTGLPISTLSDYLNDRKSMSRKRAISLEKYTLKLHPIFTRSNWMFYPSRIKQELYVPDLLGKRIAA